MKSTAWVFSWSALCRSARMRISAAFSTDRLLHSASSHITFRRSRAYCKIQTKVQLQRRKPELAWSEVLLVLLYSSVTKLLYCAEQTSSLCYMDLNCTERSGNQRKRRIIECPPWGKQWRGSIPTITLIPGFLSYWCCVHALKWEFQLTFTTTSVTSRYWMLKPNPYSHFITTW